MDSRTNSSEVRVLFEEHRDTGPRWSNARDGDMIMAVGLGSEEVRKGCGEE
jgi:hypothetical protein